VFTPWFGLDRCSVWCVNFQSEVEVWRVGSKEDVLTYLGHTVDPEHLLEGCPWAPSHGYQVTDDWWILSPDRK
jgi:hypothetical protein